MTTTTTGAGGPPRGDAAMGSGKCCMLAKVAQARGCHSRLVSAKPPNDAALGRRLEAIASQRADVARLRQCHSSAV